MAYYYPEPSHTFSEYLLIPGYTPEDCTPDRVSLGTPLTRFRKGAEASAIRLNIPLTSAIMQSVSDDALAVALAKEGGLSFLYDSQPIESQAAMVRRVKQADSIASASALLDSQNRYLVGAGINTRDYAQRVPALLEAGADVLCIDSSEGFTCWQEKTIAWIRRHYGDSVKMGAGNVVEKEGFLFLAKAGADFVKVGIGGGSICITRETKGIGRGQATALIEVAAARDAYFRETGVYVPICSDGGIAQDYHMTLALAMGADFLMLGRYFARFDESPAPKVTVDGVRMKEYWGEGSNRARNWQRYDLGGGSKLAFEEGVDSYVACAGPLHDGVAASLYKVKSAMCNCGVTTIAGLQQNARLTLVSPASITEGGYHDVTLHSSDK